MLREAEGEMLRLSNKIIMVESHIPNSKLVSCLSDSDRHETQL